MRVHLPASQHRGKAQMLGNMCDICASSHGKDLPFPSRMHPFTCPLTDQYRSKEARPVTFHCGITFPAALFRDRELLNLVCSHCCSLCTLQSGGITTRARVHGRMRSHWCGITRSLLFCKNWRACLQVTCAKIEGERAQNMRSTRV